MSSANTLRIETPAPESSSGDAERPRERILAAARDLFYRNGIRAVGVDAIAEAAATNKMTLYRHFASKDLLVAECLRRWAAEMDTAWEANARAHEGRPREQLEAWLNHVAEFKLDMAERGGAFNNAVAELPEQDHPARRVVEEHKRQSRERFIALCRDAHL